MKVGKNFEMKAGSNMTHEGHRARPTSSPSGAMTIKGSTVNIN